MRTEVSPAFLSILKSLARRCVFFVYAGIVIVTTALSAAATPLTVVIGTSSLTGINAQLAFDLIDGGPPSNAITISGFLTDGTLGGSSTLGGVTGTLPGTVILTDSSFFNEYLQTLILGTTLSLTFDATTNAPDTGSVPDAFSLFLLDSATGLPLFPTTDPAGADALVVLNLTGSVSGDLSVFSATTGEATISVIPANAVVPEPRTVLLLASGVALWVLWRRFTSSPSNDLSIGVRGVFNRD